MRKQTKLALGLSAAALLAVGASMTSFAARGWVAEGDQWYYYDSQGDYVTDKWKSYNGNYFYLGSDGYMLTNELIEDGNNYYYVDANGAMVKNTWVAVPSDDSDDQDVDYRWYYFGSNGKAYRDADKKTINGKKYGFDDEGKMLFGFTLGRECINDEDDAILNCERYYGSNDDGAMHTGWLLYQDALDASGYDDEFYWFWFDSKGLKKTNATKKINGKTYAFDPNGAMEKEWAKATISGVSTEGWFSAAEDGHLAKSQWIWTDNEDLSHDGGDDNHWWYANKNGFLVKNQTKKINGKWYVFDENGEMAWGLVWLTEKSVKTDGSKMNNVLVDSKGVRVNDPEDISSADIYDVDMAGEGAYLHFFSNDEEKDGSMKTGTSIKITLYDDDFTFGFDKNSGCAYNEIYKNKLYINGILQTADDNRYAPIKWDGGYRLVSGNGTVMKASQSRTYKDADDIYWYVPKDGELYYGETAKAAKGEDKDYPQHEYAGEVVK
jgi:glucan-binding YG repeat protein